MLRVSHFCQVFSQWVVENRPSCGDISYAMLPPEKAKESEEQQPTSQEVDSMTLDGLRQQLKAKKLPTSGNKKTLAARLCAHLDRSGTSNRAKQTDMNPRLRETHQRERRKTDHNRHISPSLEPRITAHKKPLQWRSTAAACQCQQDWQWRTQSPPPPTSNWKPPARFPEH